jgi:ABC-type uncharacterized transport system involved in gliding motility auxiliary subunit
MAKRPARFTIFSNTALGFIAFVGILVLVILIGQRHPLRLDLTESKRYSISDQSQKIVRALKDDIHIKAFFQEAERQRDEARDLLETYRHHSKKIHYQFIDPDLEPSLTKHYQVRTYGTLVFEGFGKTQTVTSADEESISNAIVKLTQEEQNVVYFLAGHGEKDISSSEKDGYSTAKAAIEKENYEVKTLNLLVDPNIPEDASLIIIAGPQKPLLASEVELLEQYLKHNGAVMIMLEPFLDGGLEESLDSYGIVLASDIIVDTMSRVFGASHLMPVVTEYGDHKITEGFTIACFFPTARSVLPAEKSPDEVDLTVLASTSEYSWSERNYRFGQTEAPEFDQDKEKKGPVPVAVIAAISHSNGQDKEGDQQSEESRVPASGNSQGQAELAVFGDCDFAANSYYDLQGNADFFLNTINFLAQQENLIAIERPKPKSTMLTLSRLQGQLLFWIGLLLMPVVVLVAGVTVYQLRRKHR